MSREEQRQFDAWRKSMARVPLPKKGCFTASYPGNEWHEVPCTTAPPPRPYTVGSAVDFSAVVSGHIASATGPFDSMDGVTSETNSGNPDTYSLQLNSEFFVSPACAGAANPNVCKGWQQFIYSTTFASAFIQYWLLDYSAPCPAGWTPLSIHCIKNSVNAVAVPAQPIANLLHMSLTGTANVGGTDTIIMSIPGNPNLNAMNQDDVLTLSQGWKLAEFGIFGDGGGSDATFSVGSTMAVRTTVDLATRNRVVLKQPITFEDLYHPYANSWRIVPPDSLLSNLCGDKDIDRGVPATRFYAQDLDPNARERARGICTEAGVRNESLLDACTIDVTVLGTRDAATFFARAHPPRAEIRVEPPRR